MKTQPGGRRLHETVPNPNTNEQVRRHSTNRNPKKRTALFHTQKEQGPGTRKKGGRTGPEMPRRGRGTTMI